MSPIITWLSEHIHPWDIFGLFGQALFMGRFIVQWVASEKVKQSIVPQTFWYFSLGGGAILFIYALHEQNLVFSLGQGLGLIIYLRNLYFIHGKKPAANG